MSEQIKPEYDYLTQLPNGTSVGIERGALNQFIRDCEQDGDTQLSLNLDNIVLPITDALVEGMDMSNRTSGAISLESTIRFADSNDATTAFAGLIELARTEGRVTDCLTRLSLEPASTLGDILRIEFNDEDDDTTYLVYLERGLGTIQMINKGALENGAADPVIVLPDSFDDTALVDQVVKFCVATTEIVQAASQATDPSACTLTPDQRYIFEAFDVISKKTIRHKSVHQIGSTVLQASDIRNEVRYKPIELEPYELKLGFDHIAGYETQKEQLQDMMLLFHNQDAAKRWAIRPPRGLLLYGPPGTGKTTLAEACATQLDAELVIVTNEKVYEMWVGSSAKNLAAFFDEAEEADGPVVLLFDEIDSLIKGSGNSGVDSSVLGLFKSRMSNLPSHIFVIGTTNHAGSLDPAIMRSGRFDEKIAIPLPSEADRAAIFSAYVASSSMTGLNFRELTRRSRKPKQFDIFAQDIDCSELARITEDYSGADIEEILRRCRNKKALIEIKTGDMSPISQDDLLQAIREFNQQ